MVPIEAPALHGAWLVPSDPAHAADPPRTTAYLVVLAGERDNTLAPAGLPHYVEHLVWESATRNLPRTGDGPDSNATTGQLATTYFLDGPDDALDATLATLARALEPIDLPERFMREELGIVQREFGLRVAENPDFSTWEKLYSVGFGESWPARISAIGTPASIARMTPDMAKAWRARTHRPGNAVLVVFGAVPERTVSAAIAKAFGTAPAGAALTPPVLRDGPPADTVLELVEPRLEAAGIKHLRVARLARPAPDGATLAARLDVLHGVLDSTRPGGLAGPLRYDDFIAAWFGIGLGRVDDAHVELTFEARPDRGVTNAELLDAFRSTLADIARDGIPEASVEKVRALAIGELDAMERPDLATLDWTLDAVASRDVPESVATYRRRLERVTTDEVNALVSTFAAAPNLASLLVEPGEKP